MEPVKFAGVNIWFLVAMSHVFRAGIVFVAVASLYMTTTLKRGVLGGDPKSGAANPMEKLTL